ncbi:MAG: polysaccharide biosynthesis protein [Phycisphaerales bacterium]|nr:polysaccharide biosynthesis protein [Phycisphaerales bacterium]
MTRFFMTIPEAATLVIQSAALEQSVGGAGSGGTGVPPVLSSLSTPGSTDSGGTGVPPVRNSLSLPQGAPVFVLDMGQPVRIVDLAERFVRAHGFTPRLRPAASSASSSLPAPRGTLDITFTGTRPGEKLHEELAYDAELLRPAGYPGINFWAGPAPEGDDVKRISQMVAEMSAVRHSHDRRAVLAALRRYVPTLPAAE